MRSGEIAKLTPNQVHLDVRHISGRVLDFIDLGIFATKTKARRTVPVSDRLKEILERRMAGKAPEDLIFTTSRGGRYDTARVHHCMKTVCKKAGIPSGDRIRNKKGEKIGLVFHCLRVTRTSIWIDQGYSDEIIRRATGHASLAAFKRYVDIDASVVMRLVSKEYKDGIKAAKKYASLHSEGLK